jgi:hypothetical protein
LSNVEQSRINTTFGTKTAPLPKYPELPATYTENAYMNTSNTETGCTIHSVPFNKFIFLSSAQILQLCIVLSKNEPFILYVG